MTYQKILLMLLLMGFHDLCRNDNIDIVQQKKIDKIELDLFQLQQQKQNDEQIMFIQDQLIQQIKHLNKFKPKSVPNYVSLIETPLIVNQNVFILIHLNLDTYTFNKKLFHKNIKVPSSQYCEDGTFLLPQNSPPVRGKPACRQAGDPGRVGGLKPNPNQFHRATSPYRGRVCQITLQRQLLAIIQFQKFLSLLSVFDSQNSSHLDLQLVIHSPILVHGFYTSQPSHHFVI